MAEKYVRLRLSNMRGLDLNVFDFDYDLTWVALMLSPEGEVLGRFGGRNGAAADAYLSLAGLRHALEKSWRRFEEMKDGAAPAPRAATRFPEDHAGAAKLGTRSCIHCHHVHEFQRQDALAKGTWQARQEYRYPEPETLGLTLDVNQGDRVVRVLEGSAATRAGLRAGDVLRSLGGRGVASILDVQHALDRAPHAGDLWAEYSRGGAALKTKMPLPPRWKEATDLSWRWSLKALPPEPPVVGEDLSAVEKKSLGMAPGRLAFRQGPFLTGAARRAGIQSGDVIVGVDDKELSLTARQFEAYFRLYHRSGDAVVIRLLRGKEKMEFRIK